eukprot:2747981-Pyramimonas_sp.AAC.1
MPRRPPPQKPEAAPRRPARGRRGPAREEPHQGPRSVGGSARVLFHLPFFFFPRRGGVYPPCPLPEDLDGGVRG